MGHKNQPELISQISEPNPQSESGDFPAEFSVSAPPLKILKMYKLATVVCTPEKTHCR